ncbi:DUF2306 domain-containing protein [Noviherbaspirillum sedimenti]|uniref:DUF2306 domain-containing protein n=1 Tax=Noviherbaspirillum sedimenti TaxID=2320865 RepID=A0A3A3GAZ3_9BURK|nr:DUF2306 domain-containing protein [Noviherbaspirillum sedimenti]RJG03949.1 DUF2306 domain-containing protein [Noviherbaspirillum sedimenti]
MTSSPAIAIHLSAAFAALLLGGAMLTMRKGTPRHRLLGRSWVLVMVATAISSFWIKTHGHYSWIHLLSVWVLFALGVAVVAIYKGNVRAHRRWITGTYVGLAAAGIFTLLPQRLLGALVWRTVGFM